MNIIGINLAKQAETIFNTTKTKLGVSIKGTQSTLDARLDALYTKINNTSDLTNARIQADAINIIKMHERINLLQLQTKYQKSNLYFDDFIDATGTSVSGVSMTFNSTLKQYENNTASVCAWKTTSITSAIVPSKCMLIVNGSGLTGAEYQISRNGGSTLTAITPETLFSFASSIATGTSIVIRIANINPNGVIGSVGLIWSE